MKKCNKCSFERPLEEYHNDKYSKDGKTTICKWCRNLGHSKLRDTPWYREQEKKERDKRREKPEIKERELRLYREWIKNNKEYVKSNRWYAHKRLGIKPDRSKYKEVLKEIEREKIYKEKFKK